MRLRFVWFKVFPGERGIVCHARYAKNHKWRLGSSKTQCPTFPHLSVLGVCWEAVPVPTASDLHPAMMMIQTHKVRTLTTIVGREKEAKAKRNQWALTEIHPKCSFCLLSLLSLSSGTHRRCGTRVGCLRHFAVHLSGMITCRDLLLDASWFREKGESEHDSTSGLQQGLPDSLTTLDRWLIH